jgi:hypothetical protein
MLFLGNENFIHSCEKLKYNENLAIIQGDAHHKEISNTTITG